MSHPVRPKNPIRKIVDKEYHNYQSRIYSKTLGFKKCRKNYLKRPEVKVKVNSRTRTLQLKLPKRPCKFCGSFDVELHHNIYPKTGVEIRQAFKDGQIYWVCYDCHMLNCHKINKGGKP